MCGRDSRQKEFTEILILAPLVELYAVVVMEAYGWIWLMNLAVHNSVGNSQINHPLRAVDPFGHVGDFVATVCESVLMELRQHFLITRNKHSREVKPPSAPNYCFTQMSDSPIWTICCAILFGAHLPLSHTSHSRLTWWACTPPTVHSTFPVI